MTSRLSATAFATLLAIVVLVSSSAHAISVVQGIFARAAGVVDPGGTTVKGPDSISVFNGALWVVYQWRVQIVRRQK